jgi:cytochrome c oxidase cbb3-type subunit IV
MNIGMFHSVWTLLLMVIFIAIIVWAWSGKRKRSFDEAARMPLEEENERSS